MTKKLQKLINDYFVKHFGYTYNPTTEMVGYNEVEKLRWSRKCTSCGFEDTFKLKPIIMGIEPEF